MPSSLVVRNTFTLFTHCKSSFVQFPTSVGIHFLFNRRKSSLGIIVSEDESTAVMEGMTYGNM